MPHDEFKHLMLYVMVFWLAASTIAFAHINLSGANEALSFKLGLMGGLFGPAFGFYMFTHRKELKTP